MAIVKTYNSHFFDNLLRKADDVTGKRGQYV